MSIFYMKWLKFSVVALFAAAFIGLILYVVFMQDVIRSSDVEPPLISAPEQAVKRRPDQPGGMQVPNQDKMVFDLLDTSGTEQVMPEESQVAAAIATEEDVAAVPETSVAEDEPVAIVAEPTPTVAVAAVSVKEPEPIAPVVAAKPEPVKEAPVVVAPKTASTGEWGVQLASVRSKADADAALKKLANQFAVLRGLEGRVQAASVSGGTSYRIQFVGATSREAAAGVCKTLGAKQACYPVKK